MPIDDGKFRAGHQPLLPAYWPPTPMAGIAAIASDFYDIGERIPPRRHRHDTIASR